MPAQPVAPIDVESACGSQIVASAGAIGRFAGSLAAGEDAGLKVHA